MSVRETPAADATRDVLARTKTTIQNENTTIPDLEDKAFEDAILKPSNIKEIWGKYKVK